MCDTDGSNCGLQSGSPNNTVTGQIDSVYGVSKDGHSFLYNRGDHAIVYHDDGVSITGIDVSGTLFGGSVIDTAYFLPGDTHVLLHLKSTANGSSTVWQTVDLATGTGNPIGGSSTFNFLDSRPGYALMVDNGAHKLGTFSPASATIMVLSTAATPNAIFNADLSVIWEATDGTTHMSNADKSLAPLTIDTGSTMALYPAGAVADGRNYFVAERSGADFDTMLVTVTSTSAQTIAGSASSERGVFLP